MRTRTRLTIAAAGGVLATALVAAPALASARADAPGPNPTPTASRQAGPGTDVCDGTGIGTGAARGPQAGMGNGRGGSASPGAAGRGGGHTGAGLSGAASGSLTAQQQASLAGMAEEELLAHDLYAAFAGQATSPVLARVADAETRHLLQIRILLDRYDVTDPSSGHTAGTFADQETQATYDRLLAEGSVSNEAALAAARAVEQADLQLLDAATVGLSAPDVELVYSHLSAATQRHLTAFGG